MTKRTAKKYKQGMKFASHRAKDLAIEQPK